MPPVFVNGHAANFTNAWQFPCFENEKQRMMKIASENLDWIEIAINGSTFSGKAGDFFVFPKQQKHAIKNTSTHDCVLLIGALADKL